MTNLEELRDQEGLQDIDLELCRFLKQRHESLSEKVLLAACLVSYLYRQGDVCLQLDRFAGEPVFEEINGRGNIEAPDFESWVNALKNNEAVGQPGAFKPLILDESGRLYLHKLWYYENSLAKQLMQRSVQPVEDIDCGLLEDGLNRLFALSNNQQVDWQKVGTAVSVRNKLTIISGGPGTGKTSTVVRILALLLEQEFGRGKSPSVALAAPTGKAAARLKESLVSAKKNLNVSDEIRSAIPEKTVTLHQLLGARRHSSTLQYNEEKPVPYDIIVVDEASMVDQALMSKLMNALLENTRVILLGDKDQLASVEAGSVLGDICSKQENQFSKEATRWLQDLSITIPDACIIDEPHILTDHITLLTKSYRFGPDSGIARLAGSVNNGNVDTALKVLHSSTYKDASLLGISDQRELKEILSQEIIPHFKQILDAGSVDAAIDLFNDFRILAAHRRGPWGVEYLNRYVEKILWGEGLIPKYEQWYPGKPVIINVNDYSLGLHNGDTGICLRNRDGELNVFFRDEGVVRGIAPGRLPNHSAAFALTVHKSQGSEFDRLLFMLPNSPSKVLRRELIYTAITRARTSITIVGNKSVLRYGIDKKLERSSGLRNKIWG